jgi:glycosyltransferase involved in cell wall biosynthesis
MKITLYSNYLNHLQTSFCDEMHKQLGDNFIFVSTEKLPIDRLSSGYQDCSHYPYNLNSFENEINFNRALRLGIESDIVIIGSAPEIFVKERLLKNKHTFRYYERLLKQGEWRLLDPRVLFSLFRYHTQYRKKNLYMLCASAFTANDLNLVCAYPQKKFKWGYFTAVEELDIDHITDQKPTNCIEIIWTGRFLDWKHPELAVQLAYELKKKGYSFNLNMIGAGEQVDMIQKLIQKLDVSDCVTYLGSVSNIEVRNLMQKSNLFIFTSDRNEGWGAVLNEAMSNGCAVIAANTIGSVPYLIEHKKNGLVFKSGSLSSLVKQTESLMTDASLRNRLSVNAYHTMVHEWNPQNAASKLLLLSESILDGKKIFFEQGPCSAATKTKNNFGII